MTMLVKKKIFPNSHFFLFFLSAPGTPVALSHNDIPPSKSHGPRINLTWSRPAEANGIIRSYTVFYTHNGDEKKESLGKDVFSYLADVFGGITYHFHVRAVTIKPGENASLTVKTKEYGGFSFLSKYNDIEISI